MLVLPKKLRTVFTHQVSKSVFWCKSENMPPMASCCQQKTQDALPMHVAAAPRMLQDQLGHFFSILLETFSGADLRELHDKATRALAGGGGGGLRPWAVGRLGS